MLENLCSGKNICIDESTTADGVNILIVLLCMCFTVFDQNKDGFIGRDDIRHIMSLMGEDFTDDDIDEIVTQADVDGDGKINFQGNRK